MVTLFQKDELEAIIKKEKIKIYIVVHQYGYYQELPDTRAIIIEDYSQTLNIFDEEEKKGEYIVLSIGKTKRKRYNFLNIQ